MKRNEETHLTALSLTKLGDGLINPKIVITWLMTYVGASAGLVGLLVPIREAGALLPQLFTAAKLRQVAVRKWWWVIGSVIQGLAVGAIAMAAIFLEGQTAGVCIVLAVTVFALARSICSVSYKDVLGKTVEKPRRGVTTGTASSIAAFGVLGFGVLLMVGVIDRLSLVLGALLLASVSWLIAALVFSRLEESASVIATDGSESVWRTYVGYLLHDTELQKFLIVRALLTVTAVAPPFLLLLAASETAGILSQLGALVVAASLATFISGRVWGQLADRSTAGVLVACGWLSGIFLVIAVYGSGQGWYEFGWFLPALLLVFLMAYQGVRTARSIHLVNLAAEDTRAAYTAISNTIIGIVILATALFGVLAESTSIELVLSIMAGMSFAGGLIAVWLKTP